MTTVSMTVNGSPVSRDVEDNTLLAFFLRESLGLTGTHVGCDTTQCGCCVVHVDGRSVKSCTMLAAQANGCAVTTIVESASAALASAVWPVPCAWAAAGAMAKAALLASRSAVVVKNRILSFPTV